jgi:hypothetical protein
MLYIQKTESKCFWLSVLLFWTYWSDILEPLVCWRISSNSLTFYEMDLTNGDLKADIIINFIKCNLFMQRYSCKIAHLELNNNHTLPKKANVFGFQSSYFEHTDQISWNRLWQMDRFNYFEVAMHLSYLGTLYLQTQWNLYIPNRFCVQNRRFHMHWPDSKTLLICPSQERPPFLYDHFFIAEVISWG